MNLYALLPLTALFANLLLGIYILYKNPKAKLNRLYALFAFALTVWALGTFLTFVSVTPQAALYWGKLAMVGLLVAPVLLLHFFLVFTKRDLPRKIFYIAMYLPALFFTLVNLTTDLIIESAAPSYWGYTTVAGPSYVFASLYIIGYFIAGIVLCYKFHSKTKSAKEKIQSKLLMIAVIIPLMGGVITEPIPLIFGFEMMPLSTIFATVMVVIIAYTIIKYRLMIPLSFSIQKKLIAIFLLIMIFTGFSIWIAGNIALRVDMEQEIYEHLESVAQSRAAHIETKLKMEKEIIESLALIGKIEKLLLDPSDTNILAVNDRLKKTVDSIEEITSIAIMDKLGIIIASTNKNLIGMDRSNNEAFLYGKKDTYIQGVNFALEGTKEPIMFFSTPVTKDNEFLGVVVLRINTRDLNKIVLDKTGIGETGETYLVNREGYAITPLLFVEDAVLEWKIDTISSRNCFYHEPGEGYIGHKAVEVFLDYRGEMVLGSHAYITEMEWCLLAEIDENEAMAPFYNMQNTTLMIVIIISIIGTIIIVLVSKTITRPIVKLKDAATKIGAGNLDVKIDVKPGDEIGELASAFSHMTRDLKVYKAQIGRHAEELEEKVVERTKELDTKINELTDSKTAILNMMEDMDETNKELVTTQEELKNSLRELKVMDIKKNEFVSVAAHELKTPLTSIHGFSQLLQNREVANNFTKRSKYLKIMDHETKRLAKLVNDILNLSRIDLGTIKLSWDKTDINKVIGYVKEEMSVQIKERGLESKYDVEKGLQKIVTDEEKLTEILINIINNAVKYTPKGKITVKVSREKEKVHFIVKDTGIGIAKEHQEKIFERFYQVDSSYTRKAGGTGLGLSLCSEFVNMLGGKIWINSKEGEGSEFHFTLPIKGVSKEYVRGEERRAEETLKKSEELRKKLKKTGVGK